MEDSPITYNWDAQGGRQRQNSEELSNNSNIHIHIPSNRDFNKPEGPFTISPIDIVDGISAFSWPIVFLVFVILCRKSLSGFIDRINNLEYGNAKLSLEGVVKSKLPDDEDVVVGDEKIDEVNEFINGKKNLSHLESIVNSWVAIENAIRELLNINDYNNIKHLNEYKSVISKRALEYLVKNGNIDYSIMATILDMREIRNLVVHQPYEKISNSTVQSYVRTAAEIVSLLK